MTNDLDRERARFERWAATYESVRMTAAGDRPMLNMDQAWRGWTAAIAAAQSDESERDMRCVAQTVEQYPDRDVVAGSIPAAPHRQSWQEVCARESERAWYPDGSTAPIDAHPSPAQCAQEQPWVECEPFAHDWHQGTCRTCGAKLVGWQNDKSRTPLVAQCAPAQPVAAVNKTPAGWYQAVVFGVVVDSEYRDDRAMTKLVAEINAAAHPLPPPVQQQPVARDIAYVLTGEKINALQVTTVETIVQRAKHAHYANVYLRINGKDELYEADWIKHMELALPPPVPQIREFAQAILHGDEQHRAWLMAAADAFIAGDPVPPPTKTQQQDTADLAFKAWSNTYEFVRMTAAGDRPMLGLTSALAGWRAALAWKAQQERADETMADLCKDCDHGIRGGKPCQSCGGTGRAQPAVQAGWQQYLKEGETPLERMERGRKDTAALLGMLAERTRLIERLLAEPYGCTLCDSGKPRDAAKGHQPDCPFEMARVALSAAPKGP